MKGHINYWIQEGDEPIKFFKHEKVDNVDKRLKALVKSAKKVIPKALKEKL